MVAIPTFTSTFISKKSGIIPRAQTLYTVQAEHKFVNDNPPNKQLATKYFIED